MGIFDASKTVSTEHMDYHGRTEVTLTLAAAPELLRKQTDIVLALDTSCSMSGEPLAHMKSGVCRLADMLLPPSVKGERRHSRCRVGVVSFAGEAAWAQDLTGERNAVRAAVERLSPKKGSNHAAAFSRARGMLGCSCGREKILILITDGMTTAGPPPLPWAEAAKRAGIEIFVVGFHTPERAACWASPAVSGHYFPADDADGLEAAILSAGREIMGAGAREIVIEERLCPDFSVEWIKSASHGRAAVTDARGVRWEIDALGEQTPEKAELTFCIRHTGHRGGRIQIDRCTQYRDSGCHRVCFPKTEVNVDWGGLFPEPCCPGEFTADSCRDTTVVSLPDIRPASQGRVIQLDVTIRDVCPHKRVAVAVILTEMVCGEEKNVGMKTFTIPAQGGEQCRDVDLHCIQFVVPEEQNGGCCSCGQSLCREKSFRARVLANYLDTDYVCCDPASVSV